MSHNKVLFNSIQPADSYKRASMWTPGISCSSSLAGQSQRYAGNAAWMLD